MYKWSYTITRVGGNVICIHKYILQVGTGPRVLCLYIFTFRIPFSNPVCLYIITTPHLRTVVALIIIIIEEHSKHTSEQQ